jgi:hypothetical protein
VVVGKPGFVTQHGNQDINFVRTQLGSALAGVLVVRCSNKINEQLARSLLHYDFVKVLDNGNKVGILICDKRLGAPLT